MDPGNVRIGIAISDESGALARPFSILKHISREEDAKRILELAENEACEVILIGIPYDSAGNTGPKARSALKLLKAIKEKTDKEILGWDESFSTEKTYQLMKDLGCTRKKRNTPVDDLAAAVILQDFLESQKRDANVAEC
ncbi:MAG: Holliday junction resolvase RuvX [Anaerolineaceae bacterium]